MISLPSLSARFAGVVTMCLAALLVAAACGGGSSPASTPPESEPAREDPGQATPDDSDAGGEEPSGPEDTPPAEPDPEPEPEPEPAPEEPPEEEEPPEPEPVVGPAPYDNDFALTVLRALTLEIGPRARGTEGELAAADYLTATFESLGYEVERQAFTLPFESVSLVELVVDGTVLTANAFGGTVGGEVEARVVVVPGLGSAADFAQVDVTGAIALVERGVLFFQEKVDNAAAAGAFGIMIYNNDPGPFSGSLADGSTIPAVSLTQAAGQSLVGQVGQGEVVATIRIEGGRRLATSENIIATTGDGSCEIYVGGHYDSVENVAGANDNGSGTSLVVALAQAFVGATGAEEICFVGFAAEEAVGGIQGIAGSRALVTRLVATGAAADVFVMLNLDVTGAGDESVVAIGSSTFAVTLVRIANALGIPGRVGNLPSNSGSDHLSFQSAGIPVIFATTTGAPIHVASDNFANIVPTVLDNLGRTAHALLQCLLVGNGAPQEAPEGCDLGG